MTAIGQGDRELCCGRAGPVDVQSSFRVYSLLLYTSWKTVAKVECRSCARKRQLKDFGFSLITGWWGVHWGVFVTPVQVIRNIVALLDNSPGPSRRFQQVVKIDLARKLSRPRSSAQSLGLTHSTALSDHAPQNTKQTSSKLNPIKTSSVSGQ
jgi:hypothetical protein